MPLAGGHRRFSGRADSGLVERGSAGSRGWPLAAAASTAMCGVLTVIAAATDDVPWGHDLLLSSEPGPMMALGHVLALGAGAVLVYLAHGILDRRRRALDAAIVVLVAVAVLDLVKGLDFEEAAAPVALAALLARGRRACTRRTTSRPPLLAATVAVGTIAAFYVAMCAAFAIPGRPGSLAGTVARGAQLLGSGGWLHASEPTRALLTLLFASAVAASAVAVRGLLRPVAAREGHSAEEHARALRIVRAYGNDSLAPFVLREDKAFFFAAGGFLAYRTLRETAVVSGDPIGPPGAAAAIVADFLEFATARGWDVVLTAVSQRLAAECRALGLRSLCIGEEAVVRPSEFSLQGRRIRKVRQSVTRAERRGWSVELVEGVGAGSTLARELGAVESRWRAGRARAHGFAMSLGRLWGAPEDQSAVYALARDPAGELRAFVRFARCRGVLSLDVMRRSGDEPNGLNEALIARTLEWARERGVDEVSLNFAGFAHVMASRASLSGRQRLLRWLLERVHGRFQLERLMVFNDKFGPHWRPRFMVYGARTHLPLAALRVLQAEAYIRAPRTRAHPRGWRPRPDLVDGGVPPLPQPGASR